MTPATQARGRGRSLPRPVADQAVEQNLRYLLSLIRDTDEAVVGISTEGVELLVTAADAEKVTLLLRVYDLDFTEYRWRKLEFDFEALVEPAVWEPAVWGAWTAMELTEDEYEVACLEVEEEVTRGTSEGAKDWPIIVMFQVREEEEADPQYWRFLHHVVAPAPREVVVSIEEVDPLWAPWRKGSLWLQEEVEA